MNDSAMAPFHAAQGYTLTAVLSADTDKGEEIILAFGVRGLVFGCDADTDALELAFVELDDVDDADDLTGDPAWSKYIGKEFSTGWLTVNQQGFADGALLSFDDVVPEVGLNVVAGAFEFLEIRQRAR
jgi:hypothetical protein